MSQQLTFISQAKKINKYNNIKTVKRITRKKIYIRFNKSLKSQIFINYGRPSRILTKIF